ncbi:hypothetical protein [Aquimarina rubra]|uniref:Uncharacterized protein n=1 Tax=Aquimarina rubra TaxID=1920033 RepID=A0ABW5LEL1_9FLAO
MNFIRWSIIVYTVVSIVHFIIGIVFFPNEFAFINRAVGSYWAMYWVMLFSSSILPFTLLIRKLESKPLYILLVAVCMKLGVYLERFVIIVTSFHRDYLPNNWSSGFINFPTYGILLFFTQGFILAILLLGFFEFIHRKNNI